MAWYNFFKKKDNKEELIVQMGGDTTKKALCVAIGDYPGKRNDLNGCINDCNIFTNMLKRQGFSSISILQNKKATRKVVLRELKALLVGSSDNDTLVFYISSHGTSIPDLNGDEADGKDEAFCLYDNVLVDDDIRKHIRKYRRSKALIIFVCDCCHSGTITREFVPYQNTATTKSNGSYMKMKYLPPEDDAVAAQIGKMKGRKDSIPQEQMEDLVMSGCKAHEFSYEMRLGGKTHGALTYFICKHIKENTDITYGQLAVLVSNSVGKNSGKRQHPQLEGMKENKKRKAF